MNIAANCFHPNVDSNTIQLDILRPFTHVPSVKSHLHRCWNWKDTRWYTMELDLFRVIMRIVRSRLLQKAIWMCIDVHIQGKRLVSLCLYENFVSLFIFHVNELKLNFLALRLFGLQSSFFAPITRQSPLENPFEKVASTATSAQSIPARH